MLAIAFSPDGQWLAAGDYNGLLLAWRLEGGAPKGDPVKLMDDGGSIYSLVFDPRGRWLSSGDAKGRLMIWDLANPKARLASFAASKTGIFAVDASPDGRWLAGAALDQNGVVHLWDMASFSSGKTPPEFILGGFTNSIYAVKFSPDGHWLAAGGNDYTLRLWDVTRLVQLDAAKTPQPDPQEFSAHLKDHESAVYFIAFSPDSRWLLSGSTDSTLRQWDTANPRQLPVKFSGHSATVRTVAITPDGLYAISASPDGTLRRWTLSLEGLVNAACAQVRRSLRPEETRRYMNGMDPAPVCP